MGYQAPAGEHVPLESLLDSSKCGQPGVEEGSLAGARCLGFKALGPVRQDHPDSRDRSWRVGAESEEVQGPRPGALEPSEVDGMSKRD